MVAVLRTASRRTEGQRKERHQGKKLTTARDIYQLVVGEIGISPHEFLYELSYWEVLRIIRGYRRRGRLRDQLIAEAVFAAMHTMRDSKGKTVKDFFPMLFEDPDDDDREPADITDEEIAELQAEMDAWNMANRTEPAK